VATVAAFIVASGFFVVGAAPAASASSALPPTCSGDDCSWESPILTRCADATSHVVRQESPAWGGTARLWRSETCQTAWSQYIPPDRGNENYYILVRNSFEQATSVIWQGPLVRPFVLTDQLYSPGPAELCVGRAPANGGLFDKECWSESA
jgi:hypothetical protein